MSKNYIASDDFKAGTLIGLVTGGLGIGAALLSGTGLLVAGIVGVSVSAALLVAYGATSILGGMLIGGIKVLMRDSSATPPEKKYTPGVASVGCALTLSAVLGISSAFGAFNGAAKKDNPPPPTTIKANGHTYQIVPDQPKAP